MLRQFPALALSCLLGLSLLLGQGCQAHEPGERFVVGFSQCTMGDEWRQGMVAEMQRELAFHKDISLIVEDAGGDNARQVAQIERLLARGIDLLIVSPNEAKPITPIVERAYLAGTPVILLDRKTDSELYTAYLGGDNYGIGNTAAQYLGLEGRRHIIEIWGLRGSTPAIERHQGFADGLAAWPDARVVAALDGRWEKPDVLAKLGELLQKHPEADAIFAHNDRMALAAYQVAKQMGRQERLSIVGVDGLPGHNGGLDMVGRGFIKATLLYPTGGEEAIRMAADILRRSEVSKDNILQTTVIDRRNVHIMAQQANKIVAQQRNIERQEERLAEQSRLFHNQRTVSYVLLAMLLVLVVLGLWLYKSLYERRNAYHLLEQQKQALEQQSQQLRQLAAEAEAANQSRTAFFTNISHEFRTPLTLILGYVESLLSAGQALGKSAKRDLGMVRGNALRLLRLVNQLMDLRKIESQRMPLRASRGDLVAFCADIVAAFEKMALTSHIELRFFSREAHLEAYFDHSMMDKVLFNLLSNAFKFTPQDGKGRIDVVLIRDTLEGMAVIKVEDNGVGMSAEQGQRVFERFFQGHPQAGGTGLGLALSQELVQLHQGQIRVWSELNRGSRFEVWLPLGQAHLRPGQIVDDTGAERDETLLALAQVGAGKPLPIKNAEADAEAATLLIIEDNGELRQLLARALQSHYRVLESDNGLDGLDMALRVSPDAILLDVDLPGKDGLSLTRLLKADLRSAHIPIVLLTAHGQTEAQIEGIRSGADAYVTKPFNFVYLSELLKNLLAGRQRLKERYASAVSLDKLPQDLRQGEQDFVKRFKQHIDTHYADPGLTVNTLAEHFGLSRVQLYRKAKQLLGEGVNDYIQHARLKKACQLLLEAPQLSVAEVGYQVGYSSPSYFSTAFKARFACSPSEFRSKHGAA